MVRHRALKAGLALVGLLALPALLPAQTPTPTPSITNIQSGFVTLTNSVATNGAAITAGTQEPSNCTSPGSCLNLFINGNFNNGEGVFNEVTWTENGVQTFLFGSQSATQLVVNVPMNLYASTGTATITVTESEAGFANVRGARPACIGCSTTATYTVNPAMASIGQLPTGIVGVAYSQLFFTGGTGNLLAPPSGPPPAQFTVKFAQGSPPPGLGPTSDNPPLLAGMPTQSGTFSVIGTVTDSWGNQLPLNDGIVILARLVITTASLPPGTITHAYNTTVAATGGVGLYTWSATGLPAGLTINSSTGAISGTPTVSGVFPVTVTVTDPGFIQPTFAQVINPDGTNGSRLLVPHATPPAQSAQANYNLTIDPLLTIATASIPNGTITHAYNATITAMGGATPYTWTATGLPAGLGINSSTGVISGTPTVTGPFTATVTVTDSGGTNNVQTAQASYNLTINTVVTINTPSLPPGTITHAYSATVFATGGATPYTWNATGLPAGLNINSSTGVISGTPTVSGTFPVSVTVTDSGGVNNIQTATANYSLTIVPLLTITTGSLPPGTIMHTYSATVTVTGGTPPYTWTATGLPAGLNINSTTGVISGTPTVSGVFPVTVTVTDSGGFGSLADSSAARPVSPRAIANGQTATANYNLTINTLPTITTTSLSPGRVQLAYSATLGATGGVTPYTWAATGLPGGLSINASTGVISGTPTTAGTSSVALSVSDSNGQSAQATLPLQIIGLLTISASLPQGIVATGYSGSVSATGGVPPYTFSASGLPGGLSINSSTGVVSGTPSSTGTSSVTLRVTDSGGTLAQSAQVIVSLTIVAPTPPPLQITTPSLGGGTAGQIYSALIAASGGTGGYSFAVISGGLPGTVQLALGGQLYGTPTTAGTYSFTAQVTDSSGNTATRGFSIVIAPATLAVTGTPPSTVPVNSTLSVQFNATGGVAPYKIALSGSTPTGTSFSNGLLSGVASAPGTFSFTVTASDSQKPPATASQGYTITVTPGPLTISANLPVGQVGQSYSGQFTATGGTGVGYTWSGSGTNGLSVSSSGGVSGTPTSVGNASINVTVTDSSGAKASGSFSVVIAGPGLIVTTTSLLDAALTVNYSATLGASGGTTPYSWSATGLPNGLSLSSSSGAISGTPTQQGSFSVNVTVTDHNGTTATASLSLTVGPAPVTITTTGITPPVIGASFSVTFGATGGTPPYTWIATGLPGGVTMDPNGTLSGTPTSIGTFPITVTVTDSKGQKTTQNLNLVVALPAAPNTSLNGFPANGTPGTQVTSGVTFSAPYPVDVTVNLTLTFAPTSGADDPNVQFATGGRTTTVTVKAGSTTSLTTIGVQTGTVAGVITITEQLVANGTDITSSPAPTRTITIGASAPTVSSVTVTPGTNQFTVVVVGFDPTRAITQVNFTFTPAAGATLQTSTVSIPAQTLFSQWYQSAAATPFGSQFSFTITFTVGGNVSSIQSVTVTLVNATGTSSGVSAPV